MSIFQIIALLLVLAGGFGLLNHHVLRLPTTVGLVFSALAVSFGAILLDRLLPGLGIGETARSLITRIDFAEALMQGMLSFLLFAGALHVNIADLSREKWTVGVLASGGVLLATFLVGLGLHLALDVPFLIALVFGALISPTDPVAVMGILKTVRVPKSLETRIGAESLLNDGVGVVIFLVMVALAFGAGHGDTSIGPVEVVKLFAAEAVGGALLGALAGWIAFQAIRSVDEYTLEVILTLALVAGTYALASVIHVSGPIAVVVAGLIIGNRGMEQGMSETTRLHVRSFWHLTDEILNAILFLLIGFEVLAIAFDASQVLAALVAIPLTLAARLISVSLPLAALRLTGRLEKGAIAIMTWGGLRGGISVALALSLPEGEWKPLILTATYAVVIFSICVQGLTVGPLIRRASGLEARPEQG
mgnify:CR=1 FL=1